MQMGRLEKLLVNREAKARRNVSRVSRHLGDLLPWRGQDALELGAGIGDVGASLALHHAYKVRVTDADPAQVRVAQDRHGQVRGLVVALEDVSALTLEDSTIDLVICQNVFHHVPRWSEAVREIARVLRVGGHLLWFDLAVPGWLRPLAERVSDRMGIYTAEEIRDAFKLAGLDPVREERVFHGITYHHDLVFQKKSGAAA